MGQFLDAPVLRRRTVEWEYDLSLGGGGDEEEEEEKERNKIAHCCVQGWRTRMEDRYLVEQMRDLPPGHSIIAVFDGHGGSHCAQYVSRHFLRVLRNTAAWRSISESDRASVGMKPHVIATALRQACLAIDMELLTLLELDSGFDESLVESAGDNFGFLARGEEERQSWIDAFFNDDPLATKEKKEEEGGEEEVKETDEEKIRRWARPAPYTGQGGTTLTLVFVTPTHFISCNVGDSRCCLIRDNQPIELTNDHKPKDKAEKARIVNAGGTVERGRVDGRLAVSRALGDHFFKRGTRRTIAAGGGGDDGEEEKKKKDEEPRPPVGVSASTVPSRREEKRGEEGNVDNVCPHCGRRPFPAEVWNRLPGVSPSDSQTDDWTVKSCDKEDDGSEEQIVRVRSESGATGTATAGGGPSSAERKYLPEVEEGTEMVTCKGATHGADACPLRDQFAPERQKVSAVPDIVLWARPGASAKDDDEADDAVSSVSEFAEHYCNDQSQDSWLVVACDGLWGSMTSSNVANFIFGKLDADVADVGRIARDMINHTLAIGCRDNISVILVALDGAQIGEVNGPRVHPSAKEVLKWKPDKIEKWLTDKKLTKHAHKFGPDGANMDGKAFLSIKEEDLMKHPHEKYGDKIWTKQVGGRKKIMAQIELLRAGVTSWTPEEVGDWIKKTVEELGWSNCEDWPDAFKTGNEGATPPIEPCDGKQLTKLRRQDLKKMLETCEHPPNVIRRRQLWENIDLLRTEDCWVTNAAEGEEKGEEGKQEESAASSFAHKYDLPPNIDQNVVAHGSHGEFRYCYGKSPPKSVKRGLRRKKRLLPEEKVGDPDAGWLCQLHGGSSDDYFWPPAADDNDRRKATARGDAITLDDIGESMLSAKRGRGHHVEPHRANQWKLTARKEFERSPPTHVVKSVLLDPDDDDFLGDIQATMEELELKKRENPHILTHSDYFISTDEDGNKTALHIVTPFCKGGHLFQHFAPPPEEAANGCRGGRRGGGTDSPQREISEISEQRAAHVMHQVFSALKQAAACSITQGQSKNTSTSERKPVLHGHLKPEHILFETLGSDDLKVADFGFPPTYDALYLSPHFIAPDFDKDNIEALVSSTHFSDMWSAGVILYMLLCGHPPYSNKQQRTSDGAPPCTESFDLIVARIDEEKRLQTEDGDEREILPKERHPQLASCSQKAQELVRKLLSWNKRDRGSAKDILKHPWLAENGYGQPDGSPTSAKGRKRGGKWDRSQRRLFSPHAPTQSPAAGKVSLSRQVRPTSRAAIAREDLARYQELVDLKRSALHTLRACCADFDDMAARGEPDDDKMLSLKELAEYFHGKFLPQLILELEPRLNELCESSREDATADTKHFIAAVLERNMCIKDFVTRAVFDKCRHDTAAADTVTAAEMRRMIVGVLGEREELEAWVDEQFAEEEVGDGGQDRRNNRRTSSRILRRISRRSSHRADPAAGNGKETMTFGEFKQKWEKNVFAKREGYLHYTHKQAWFTSRWGCLGCFWTSKYGVLDDIKGGLDSNFSLYRPGDEPDDSFAINATKQVRREKAMGCCGRALDNGGRRIRLVLKNARVDHATDSAGFTLHENDGASHTFEAATAGHAKIWVNTLRWKIVLATATVKLSAAKDLFRKQACGGRLAGRSVHDGSFPVRSKVVRLRPSTSLSVAARDIEAQRQRRSLFRDDPAREKGSRGHR